MILLLCILAASVGPGASRRGRCHDKFRCRDGEKCIPKWYLCDGENDCRDQSDEDNATCAESCTGPSAIWCEASGRCLSSERSCLANSALSNVCKDAGFAEACARYCTETEGLVSCRNDSSCVRGWMCSGYIECADGSDEDFMTCGRLCAEKSDHVLCTSSLCLPKDRYCLHFSDCGADVPADFCADICHANDFFLCNVSSGSVGRKCVPSRYVCDGDFDCPEGEDESGSECKAKCAAEGKFMCDQGEGQSGCISAGWVCDGEKDCPNGDDEDRDLCESWCNKEGVSIYCEAEKRCRALAEICSPGLVAETECDIAPCKAFCQSRGFVCSGNVTSCIPGEWKCDGDMDCPGGEDEAVCGGNDGA